MGGKQSKHPDPLWLTDEATFLAYVAEFSDEEVEAMVKDYRTMLNTHFANVTRGKGPGDEIVAYHAERYAVEAPVYPHPGYINKWLNIKYGGHATRSVAEAATLTFDQLRWWCRTGKVSTTMKLKLAGFCDPRVSDYLGGVVSLFDDKLMLRWKKFVDAGETTDSFAREFGDVFNDKFLKQD